MSMQYHDMVQYSTVRWLLVISNFDVCFDVWTTACGLEAVSIILATQVAKKTHSTEGKIVVSINDVVASVLYPTVQYSIMALCTGISFFYYCVLPHVFLFVARICK